MKAFQIISPLHTALKEIEAPACRTGEVLLRIRYVGFCGSDLNTYLGRNPMVRMPVIPGHEVGATIEAVGTDVPDFCARDRMSPSILTRIAASVPLAATGESMLVNITRLLAYNGMAP